MRDPKGKLWLKVRKEIIADFERRGIMQCEMCHSQPPTFERTILDLAHSKKRRCIKDLTELKEVALLCRHCHNFLETGTHEVMYQTITEIIKRRDGLETIFD